MIILQNTLNMQNLLEVIKIAFQNYSDTITVCGKDTFELYDVNYTIFMRNFTPVKVEKFFFDKEAIEMQQSESADDEIERFKLLAAIQKFCENELKVDLNSRQCVIQQKYNDNDKLASCISFIQLIKRNDVLDLHIVVRSQNFDKNFEYDNYTFYKCLKLASEKTGIRCGTIHIKVISLHIFL